MTRQPGVLADVVNQAQHANWSNVMGISKKKEVKAMLKAQNTNPEYIGLVSIFS